MHIQCHGTVCKYKFNTNGELISTRKRGMMLIRFEYDRLTALIHLYEPCESDKNRTKLSENINIHSQRRRLIHVAVIFHTFNMSLPHYCHEHRNYTLHVSSWTYTCWSVIHMQSDLLERHLLPS